MKSILRIFPGILLSLLLTSCGKHNEPVPPPPPVVPHVQIGTPGDINSVYLWSPTEGLDNPTVAQPIASPSKTTLYTVTVTNKCGQVKASTTVHVFKKDANGKIVEVVG